jgi:hypothetical protein
MTTRPSLSLFLLSQLLLVLAPPPSLADVLLPPGFTAQVYVTGEGFDTDSARAARGLPSTSTMVVDRTGTLYLARTGRRYSGGEFEYLWPIYRIPVGGARLTPKTEGRYLHGPPLTNSQVGAFRGPRELLLTTFDRDRKVGAIQRMVDGRAELFAGGTPHPGQRPLLIQPEGVAVDSRGHVYVADREQGVVVRLDPEGRVLDPSYLKVMRPRLLALDGEERLWIGADGEAAAPWQNGPGEIWQMSSEGEARRVLRGPMAQGIALSPGGYLFVTDRHAAQVFAVTGDGTRVELARFAEGDAPRGIAFAPVTPETRAAGIAGNLFMAVIRRSAWPVNEIVRISGPFDDLVRERQGRSP